MRTNYGIGQLSASEKSDILDQHRSLYNGYQTMQPQVSNTQPLYVFDAAGDKEGLVVNNKGEVKKYTNMGINEQSEALEGFKDFFKKKPNKNKGKVLLPKGDKSLEMKVWNDEDNSKETKEVCDECGAMMTEGMCTECNYGHMEEETGHLDDIYNQKDLNLKHGDFDYVEGGGNDYGTFEGMHKKEYQEDDNDKFVNYDDNFENPDNEDDGFEDMELGNDIEEDFDVMDDQTGYHKSFKPDTYSDDETLDDLLSYFNNQGIKVKTTKSPVGSFEWNYDDETDEPSLHIGHSSEDELRNHLLRGKRAIQMNEQGGNAPDMNVSDVEPAYDFDSDGPMAGGDVYPVNEYEDEDETEFEFEAMESAWADEIDEVDVSGSQGVYGDMDPAYDFDSGGPGQGGPYQEFSYESVEDEDGEEEEEESFDIDEDLQEDFQRQKNKISEMFNRMSRYN
jgi:hypothetical protein